MSIEPTPNRNRYWYMNGPSIENVFVGPGTLKRVVIGGATANLEVLIWDNSTPGGTLMVNLNFPGSPSLGAPFFAELDLPFSTGLSVTLTGVGAVTMVYNVDA